ncbi:hypothetical protein BJY04DRAFT_180447 [Aspergillus karnatakaensis]|uniref:uncharacterized protein n=1 Tax=Aspergillus karnatakaensis TaxID=1810916 RepID=UPI003CCCF4F1
MGKLTFHHTESQWYLGQHLAPILTLFAIFSVALNAMQVGLSVPDNERLPGWYHFAGVSRWFAVVSLILVAVFVALILDIVGFMFVHNLWFSWIVLRHEKEKAKGNTGGAQTPVFQSSVV